MKMIKVELIGKGGTPGGFYWIVPSKVHGIAEAMVPGSLAGPDGVPIFEHKAALDLGSKMIVVNLTPEEMVKKIEESDQWKIEVENQL